MGEVISFWSISVGSHGFITCYAKVCGLVTSQLGNDSSSPLIKDGLMGQHYSLLPEVCCVRELIHGGFLAAF